MKFLSYNGLIYFWGKVKAALNTKADTGHKHGAADITSGTLALARGGTGATTAEGARNTLGAAATSHTHANYVNQNAFSNVKIGSTTIEADSATDNLTLEAGSNVTLTADAANDKITISATDTKFIHPTYPSKSNGLYKVTIDGTGHVSATSAVTKADITALGIPAQDTNTTYGVATTGALGLVKSGTDITVDANGNVSVVDDSHNHIISNVDGLQSALDGKAATSHTHSSYVNQNAFSNVTVGSTTIAADNTTDTLTLEAGNNVKLTPDAAGDKVTISATNTVYTHPDTPGNKHIPSGGSSGEILKWSRDGAAYWGDQKKELTLLKNLDIYAFRWTKHTDGYYMCTPEVYGLLENEDVFVCANITDPTVDFQTAIREKEALQCLDYTKALNNKLVCICFSNVPTNSTIMRLKVFVLR